MILALVSSWYLFVEGHNELRTFIVPNLTEKVCKDMTFRFQTVEHLLDLGMCKNGCDTTGFYDSARCYEVVE